MSLARRLYRAIVRRAPFVRPVAKLISPLIPARVLAPASARHASGADCAICRGRDNSIEDRHIAELVIDAARTLGVQLWRLPSLDGLRLATAEGRDSAFIARLHELAHSAQLKVTRQTEDLANNLYEFDQVDFVSPANYTIYRIVPQAHCAVGASFLKSRGVTLELVERAAGAVIIPRPNLGPRIYGTAEIDAYKVTGSLPAQLGDWPYPIDLVYAWVDTDDDIWRANYASVAHEIAGYSGLTAATNAARWHSRDELRASLRSIEMYAPFVRNIYIVTNGQRPKWLADHPRVKVVSHAELYPDPGVLPTFNSNHIETVLHRIDGLAEHFLYLNDDFFFSRRSTPEHFFTPGGLGKVFFANRYLDDRPLGQADRATVAAHKNTRAALFKRFGIQCHRKFQHAPYVMRKSVWNDIETEFAEELAHSRRQRFRSREDINGQFLYAHYALLTGKAFAGTIEYAYFDVDYVDLDIQIARANARGVRVFCLNDANSTAETVAANDAAIAAFLTARFPSPAGWEKSPPTSGGPAVDLKSAGTFQSELRDLGPTEAEQIYRRAFDQTSSNAIAEKLFKLYYNQNRSRDAVALVDRTGWDARTKALRKLDALTNADGTLAEAGELVPLDSMRPFYRGLRMLVRTLSTPADYPVFEQYARRGKPAWLASTSGLQILASAARRAELPDRARALLEQALTEASMPWVTGSDNRRDSQTMVRPEQVLADIYDTAGPAAGHLFLDAGTALGCVRQNDFISHDYDIDLSVRDEAAFQQLSERFATDWRFVVARTRTPDLIIQARHVLGVNLDIFLHRQVAGKWIKRSHVFGWTFDDFDLEERSFKGLEVKVPSPPEHYLEQMYGPDWRIPMAGFDSRLIAPNCFFPDRDEIICTLLNKAVQAVRAGDRVAIEKNRAFLASHFDYTMPMPRGMWRPKPLSIGRWPKNLPPSSIAASSAPPQG